MSAAEKIDDEYLAVADAPPLPGLYFLQCNAPSGPVKIGHAKDIRKRVLNLRNENGAPLVLLGYRVGIRHYHREGFVLRLFAESRMHGEWFACSPGILEFIAHESTQAHDPFDDDLDAPFTEDMSNS